MIPFRSSGLVLAALILMAPIARAFDQSHALLDRLLKAEVSDGWVNYPALKSAPKPLDDYLAQLAAVPQAEFSGWRESERLAFLINLYNAATLKLIVDHYPVKSIRNIGWLPGAAWKEENVQVFGRRISLDELEHDIIRKEYREPRAHFALVCAARGCPPLRAEAFVGARLDAQLEDQGKRFLGTPAKNRVDASARIVYLSPIFKWFPEDFGGSDDAVLGFVAPFLAAEAGRSLEGYKISYTDYDWSLNDQAGR